ncbi:protein phosphatase [Trypanosoma grayi]|uniref:protein phosphatase n=1 Tax=Trypanosoma grayi TaxID=71804 RepID=UPI0004F41B04|nr:protein phosphatase [Trypanosoma grayi]KEG14344.1 protein phosphatase [Trypanosoma grayi]
MRDDKSIIVEPGHEVLIGSDVLCDIVVALPKLRVSGSHIAASCCRDMAHVLCTTKGELLLSVSTKNIPVYVCGVQIVSYQQLVDIQPGVAVSFCKRHRDTTFRFFAGSVCKSVVPPLRGILCTPMVPILVGGRDALMPLPRLPCSHALGQGRSPRSPRVVHIIEPADEKNHGGDGDADDGYDCAEVDDNNDNDGAEEDDDDDAEAEGQSYGSGYFSSSTRSSSKTSSEHMSKSYVCDMPAIPNEDDVPSPSPNALVPFVVEMWGHRTTLHSVVGNGSELIGTLSSFGPAATTKSANDTATDLYVTRRGRSMLKCIRQPRIMTPVHAAAASVLEYIDDAYEPQDGTFLQFTEHTKNALLQHFLLLAENTINAMLAMPLTMRCRSPIVCCGDIHGSFADLKTIYDNVVPFCHWSLMTMPILFLGDYVDRGPHDVEVVLYLLAWYSVCPDKVILLRGNHEDEEVNGDVESYGDLSFRIKCQKFFGEKDGETFWRRVNDVFSTLPVIAVINDTILACHGGIPLLCENKRQREECNGADDDGDDCDYEREEFDKDDTPSVELLQFIMEGAPDEMNNFRFRHLMPVSDDNIVIAQQRRLIRELLWNDPVSSSSPCDTPLSRSRGEGGGDASSVGPLPYAEFDVHGFRSNIGRGDSTNVIREFNASALECFMSRWGFTLLIRAHQQKSSGLEVGLAARILTLFSCCNYTGDTNRAGACVILDGEVRPVSWRRPHPLPGASDTRRDMWRGTRFSPRQLGSLPESLRSSFDRLIAEQEVPRYVGLEKVTFG